MRTPKIYTLDTETYQGLTGAIKRIALYDGVEVFYGFSYADIEPILKKAYKQEINSVVYIHNMEFDLRKMPEIFKDGTIVWSRSLLINNKLVKLKTRYATFIDSFSLLPMSLKDLSNGFNVDSGKLDLWQAVEETYPGMFNDAVDFLDRCDVNDIVYLKYLGLDVISLYQVIHKLIELCGIPVTNFVKLISTASISRCLFKNGWKGVNFKDPSLYRSDFQILCSTKYTEYPEIEDFVRQSYCGGRTEVFKMRSEGTLYHYDVNSLYPYVCMGDYPVGKPTMIRSPLKSRQVFQNWMEGKKKGLGFIACIVNVPKQDIPPLPVKKGKLCFPTGKIYGVWSFEELAYSIKECGVVIEEYFESVFWLKTYPVFKRFIQCFSKLKEKATEENNQALRTFSKLVQNTSYGFTGMNRDKSVLDNLKNLDKYSHMEVKSIDRNYGFVEVEHFAEAEYIQPHVASYVTSRARVVLHKAIKWVLEHGGVVYYCDTDSIVCSIPLPDEMVHPSKLGYFKLEGFVKKGLYLQPKVYWEETIIPETKQSKDVVRFKGVSKDTMKDFGESFYQDLYDFYTGTEKEMLVEQGRIMLPAVKTLMKKGDLTYFEVRDKRIRKSQNKREMDFKQNTTTAIHFQTIDDFANFSFDKKAYVDIEGG